jgi:hypothetical protein
LRLDSRKPCPKGVAQAIDFQPQATSQPITQASPHNPPTQFLGLRFPAQPSRKENTFQKQIRLQMKKTEIEISQAAQKVI